MNPEMPAVACLVSERVDKEGKLRNPSAKSKKTGLEAVGSNGGGKGTRFKLDRLMSDGNQASSSCSIMG